MFKRFLIWSSGSPPVRWSRTIMQFWKRASWGTLMWSYMEFAPVVQKEMLFKDISYLELRQPLSSAAWNHLCNFGRRYHDDEEQFCKNILNLVHGPVVQEEMLFKGTSYLELWQPFCSAECNYLCNFSRGYTEEQFCEIILNLGPGFIQTWQNKIPWHFPDFSLTPIQISLT